MWSINFITLGVLFIAFTDPSIAEKTAPGRSVTETVTVTEGAPLTVECALRVEQRAAWRLDGRAPPADLRAAGERPAPAGVLARLHAPRARPHHAGLYTCDAHSPPVRVRVLPLPHGVDVTAAPGAAEPPTTAGGSAAGGGSGGSGGRDSAEAAALRTLVTFELYKPLSFNCSPDSPNAGVTHYEWYTNGTLLTGVGVARGPLLEEGGAVLTYRRAHEDNWGNYTCYVGGDVARAWQAEALGLPRVPANTNVVEGQKFSITCKLIGKPYKRVAWWYRASAADNATELGGAPDGRHAVRDSPAGVPGGVLEVRDAARADAGEYLCRAGAAADQLAVSTVRVKDVYAALWPFLGICLEVFVLCAIILVYEKRRTKPELDDSDADTHDQ